MCYHGNKLQLLNPHRVEETLLNRELLDKHIVPVSSLENPIRLTQRYFHYVNMPVKMKYCDGLLIFAQNVDRGYSLKPPHELVKRSIHNLCFRAKIRKII